MRPTVEGLGRTIALERVNCFTKMSWVNPPAAHAWGYPDGLYNGHDLSEAVAIDFAVLAPVDETTAQSWDGEHLGINQSIQLSIIFQFLDSRLFHRVQ